MGRAPRRRARPRTPGSAAARLFSLIRFGIGEAAQTKGTDDAGLGAAAAARPNRPVQSRGDAEIGGCACAARTLRAS